MERNKIYNTHSKRNVTVNGGQYKKLLNQGFYVKNNQLYAPTNYMTVKSPLKRSPVKQILQDENLPALNEDVIDYLYNQSYDIDFIINKCKTSKAEWKKCSTKVFWVPILTYNKIYLPKENYTTTEEWIAYIKRARDIEQELAILMPKLKILNGPNRKVAMAYDKGQLYIRKIGNLYNFSIWLDNEKIVDEDVTYDQLRKFLFDSYYGGEL